MSRFFPMRWIFAATCVMGGALPNAIAQGTPNTPIRFVVGIGPGSGGDSSTRFIAERLRVATGQATVTENKTGGDQVPAVLDVLRAPADGRTILYATPTPFVINTLVQKDLPYAQSDLKPVVMSTRSFAVMVTSPDSRFKTFEDVIAAAKDKPGAVSMANYGHHYRLGAIALEKVTGARFNHVSYKGAAQANSDVIAGVVDVHITDIGGAVALIKSGKLRPLAVTGTNRHAFLPDVATIVEKGFPTYNLYVWTGYAVSAKTPDAIVKKLETDLLTVLRTPEFAEFSAQQSGAEVSIATGQQFAELVAADTARILDAMKFEATR